MENINKSKNQLLKENNQLKDKIAEVEKSVIDYKWSKEELRLHTIIVNNLPVGYNLFDMEGKVLIVNNVARRYFGVSEDDPLTSYRFFDDPSITDDTKRKVRNGEMAIEERYIDFHAIKNHKMYESEKTIQDKLFIQLLYKPYGPIDNPYGLIVIIQDFTERKQSENELRKYRNKLEDLVEERTMELEEKNKNLQEQNNELARYNKLMVGREYRIKELRDEIEKLKKKS